MAGTAGSPDNGVAVNAHISSHDRSQQAPKNFGAIDAARPGQDCRMPKARFIPAWANAAQDIGTHMPRAPKARFIREASFVTRC